MLVLIANQFCIFIQAVFAAVQAKLGSFQPEFILSLNPAELTGAWVSEAECFPIVLNPPWTVIRMK